MSAASRVRRGLGATLWGARHPGTVIRLADAVKRRDGAAAGALFDSSMTRGAAWELMHRAGVEEVRFQRGGFVWRSDVGDEISLSLMLNGGYEVEEIDAVLRWMRAQGRTDGVVVDVGANIGTTSIPFAEHGFRVVALEPVPRTFAMLSANVRDNGFDGAVSCVNSAISEVAGTVPMWIASSPGLAEIAVEGHDGGATVPVRSTPLAAVLADHGVGADEVALVWSDTQGTETGVIRSAPGLWAAGVPLYVEVWPWGLARHGGVEPFLEAVSANFASYIPRFDLSDGAGPRPVEDFPSWFRGLGRAVGCYSNALLVP